MRKGVLRGFFLLALHLYFLVTAAQQASYPSLLWRISGNGLSKPSYLFGTMHVRDPEFFHFRDSLYRFLETADAFAMELHPDSANQFLSAIANGSFSFDESDFQKESPMDRKAIEKISRKLEKDPQMKNKSTSERVSYLVKKIMGNEEDQEEQSMDVFMDAYLYRIARSHDLRIFGLEQVSAQLNAFKSLKKGLRLMRLSDLIERWDLRKGPPIYKYYREERLDSLENLFADLFTDSCLQVFLYDRNKVMVGKMDSLMRHQSLFSAVGAGHLPGTEGIIQLLRRKGYNVEPVMSGTRLFAGDYKMRMQKPNWVTDSFPVYGLQFQLPGKPVRQKGGTGGEMALHMDMMNGLVYMVVVGRPTAAELKLGRDSLLKIRLDAMMEKMDGKVLTQDPVEVNGLQGKEVVATYDGSYMRLYELFDGHSLFLFSLASEKKSLLFGENADYFLHAFSRAPLPPKQWRKVRSEADGFSAIWPAEPEAANPEKGESGTTHEYSCYDPDQGVSYGVYVIRVNPGLEQINANSLFASYEMSLRTNTGNAEMKRTDTTLNGFPAVHLSSGEFSGRKVRALVVRRNNISYLVSAEYDPAAEASGEIDRFLAAFALEPFPAARWKETGSPDKDFTVTAPSAVAFKTVEGDQSDPDDPVRTFYAQDTATSVLYQVTRHQLNEFYWAANIDSLYEQWIRHTLSEYMDSVRGKRAVQNGGLQGWELESFNRISRTNTRYRFLLNGQSLYILQQELPPSFSDTLQDRQFFHSFRVSQPRSSASLFAGGPDKLFVALRSTDTTVNRKARTSLGQMKFGKGEFNLLLQQSLQQYPEDSDDYRTINEQLIDLARELMLSDSSLYPVARSFVRDQYGKDDSIHRQLEFRFLALLARQQNGEAYREILELTDKRAPQGEYPYYFYANLNDSLSLTRQLFPGLWRHLGDPVNALPLVELMKQLVDSSLLAAPDIEPFGKELYRLADSQYVKLNALGDDELEDYDYEVTDLISLLGHLKHPEAYKKLYRLQQVKVMPVKLAATIELIRLNQPVGTVSLKELAAADRCRLDLYEELAKMGRQKLFPAEFATQQNMAKAYIYKAMTEEDEGDPAVKLIFIKKVDRMYKGGLKRFYLFRANTLGNEEYASEEEDGQKSSGAYLAIAGPFEADVRKIKIGENANVSGVYYEKEFDGMKTDEYFGAYLRYWENNE